MTISADIRKENNPTALALFGVAALQGLLGFVGWSMNGHSFGWLDWVFAFSGGIYIGLGIVARWRRLAAALIGAGFYGGFLALQLLHSVASLKSGLIFKTPVVMLLLTAAVFALRRPVAPPPLLPAERV